MDYSGRAQQQDWKRLDRLLTETRDVPGAPSSIALVLTLISVIVVIAFGYSLALGDQIGSLGSLVLSIATTTLVVGVVQIANHMSNRNLLRRLPRLLEYEAITAVSLIPATEDIKAAVKDVLHFAKEVPIEPGWPFTTAYAISDRTDLTQLHFYFRQHDAPMAALLDEELAKWDHREEIARRSRNLVTDVELSARRFVVGRRR